MTTPTGYSTLRDELAERARDEVALIEQAARLTAERDALLKDAERYRAFRQLIKDNPIRAQALVWEAAGSRRAFDRIVDQIKK